MAELAPEIHEPRTIVLPEDDSAPAEAEIETEVPAPEPSDDPNAGMEELKRQLAESKGREVAARSESTAERQRRQAAEKQASDATKAATTAASTVDEERYNSVSNALEAAKAQLEPLSAKYATLMGEGKFDEGAKIAADLGRIGARIENLEIGKAELDAIRKAPKPEPAPAPAVAAPAADSTEQREAFLGTIPAKSADWIRAHPQYFTDAAFRNKVNAAAAHVEHIEGIPHTDDDYFRRVEEQVGLRKAEPEAEPEPKPRRDPVSKAATPTPRESAPAPKPRAPTPAAAPSRSAPSSQPEPTNGNAVMLTPEERQIARLTLTPDIIGKDNDPEVVFAQNKRELAKRKAANPDDAFRTSTADRRA